jgi:hypothetical protein
MIGRARRGYDAGKKINGTKRHIAVGVLGPLLTMLVTATSVQDRDAARPAAVEPAPHQPPHPPDLGRCRLRRQAGRLRHLR